VYWVALCDTHAAQYMQVRPGSVSHRIHLACTSHQKKGYEQAGTPKTGLHTMKGNKHNVIKI
jgi:hypothetical protein